MITSETDLDTKGEIVAKKVNYIDPHFENSVRLSEPILEKPRLYYIYVNNILANQYGFELDAAIKEIQTILFLEYHCRNTLKDDVVVELFDELKHIVRQKKIQGMRDFMKFNSSENGNSISKYGISWGEIADFITNNNWQE